MRHPEEKIRSALRDMTAAAFGEKPVYFRIPADPNIDPDLIMADAVNELIALRNLAEAARIDCPSCECQECEIKIALDDLDGKEGE